MGRSSLFGTTALAGLLVAPSALAGDFSLKAVPYPDSQKLPWSGFYLGGNVGGVGSQDPSINCLGSTAPCIAGTPVAFPLVKPSGGEFGAQAGYNWQVGKFVVGVEGDAQKLFARGNAQFAGADPGKGPDRLSSGYDWLGTARVRAGMTSGSILFYATGGLAYGRVDHDYFFAIGSPNQLNFNQFENRAGWTVGGGAEYAFNPHWSLKAEYLYIHLTASSLDVSAVSGGPPGTAFLRYNNNLNILRLGANYRF